MIPTYGKYAVLALAAVVLLPRCAPSQEKIAAQEAEQAVKALPQPSPRLYLAEDKKLSEKPNQSFTQNQYLYGGSRTTKWGYELHGEALRADPGYQVIMASQAKTNVIVEIALERGKDKTVIGADSFAVATTRYTPYRGTFTASEMATEEGDRLVMRLTASGSDFGLKCGPRKSSISALKGSGALPPEVVQQREKALIWFAVNSTWGIDSDPFRNFSEVLDDAILEGGSVEWHVGWGLTKSGKPYVLEWTGGAFTAKKITVEEAGELDMKERSLNVNFKPAT